MPQVFFQTFGCQMNVADSDTVGRMLAARGFTRCESPQEADLVVVNTCSVRAHAEERALARIAEFARAKDRKKNRALWVIGCMAQRLGDDLKKRIPGIDAVIGAKEIDRLESILDSLVGPLLEGVSHLFATSAVSDFVAVMRGCNNYCAYCIVPYVRGPEQSIPVSKILDEIRQRADTGIREIVLLGQNVNSYNDNGTDFPDLLTKVAAIDQIKRIRYTTSHPKDFTEKLVRTMADNPKLCSHIHLPVQSGSDRILECMNRRYSSSHYRSLIDLIRTYIKDADITTDLMVGFPTESDDDFKATINLVKDTGFTTAFMFAYSVREGTAASGMVDDVACDVKMERLAHLIEVQTAITRTVYDRMTGEVLDVLLTGRQDRKDRLWMGQDSGCKRVLLACDDQKAGTILKVRAVRSTGMTLICESCLDPAVVTE